MVQCLIDYRHQWRKNSQSRFTRTQRVNRSARRCPEYGLCCSGWERRVCDALTARGIPHRHQSHRYPVVLGGKHITYTPDIEAGDMVIEPHFRVDSRFLAKMEAFKAQYPGKQVILLALNDDMPRIPDGIFDEKLPIECCITFAPSQDLLVPTIRKMTQRRLAAEAAL